MIRYAIGIVALATMLSLGALGGQSPVGATTNMFNSLTEDQGRPDQRSKPPEGGGFEQDDADGNGLVTRAEFSGPADLFKQLDRNGDGTISQEEARPKGGRGGRRP